MKLLLSILCLFVLMALPLAAQMEANFVMKPGILTGQGDTEQFGVMTGVNLMLFSDSASGFSTYSTTGYLYIEAEIEAEAATKAAVEMMVVQKKFPDMIGNFDPYVALGQGYIYSFGGKAGQYGMSLELGGRIFNALSVSVSDMYLPESGRHFISLNIDLMPVF